MIILNVLLNHDVIEKRWREGYHKEWNISNKCIIDCSSNFILLKDLEKSLEKSSFITFLTKHPGVPPHHNLLAALVCRILNTNNLKGVEESENVIEFLLQIFDNDIEKLAANTFTNVLIPGRSWGNLDWRFPHFIDRLQLDPTESKVVALSQTLINQGMKGIDDIRSACYINDFPDLTREMVLSLLYNKSNNLQLKETTLSLAYWNQNEVDWQLVSELNDVRVIRFRSLYKREKNGFLSNMKRVCPNVESLILPVSSLCEEAEIDEVKHMDSLMVELSGIIKVDFEIACNEIITVQNKEYKICFPILERFGLMEMWGIVKEVEEGMAWSMNPDKIQENPDEFLMWLNLAYTGKFPAKDIDKVHGWLKKKQYSTLFGSELFSDTSYTFKSYEGDEVFPLHKVFLERHEYFKALFAKDGEILTIHADYEAIRSAFKYIYEENFRWRQIPNQKTEKLLNYWGIDVPK